MARLNRAAYVGAAAGFILACAGAAVVAQTTADDGKQKQDQEKVDRELKELQEQRSKIDSRIRELRRQSGRNEVRVYTQATPNVRTRVFTGPGANGFVFSDGDVKDMKQLTPEQRKKVEEAMAEAHRAIEKAMKELPEGFVMPDIDAIVGNALRMHPFSNGAGNTFVMPEPFDKAKLKEQMDQLRNSLKQNSEAFRTFSTPRVYAVPSPGAAPPVPAVPLRRDSSPELRNELRELRDELNQLREEIRRDRGNRKPGEDRKTDFLTPFSTL